MHNLKIVPVLLALIAVISALSACTHKPPVVDGVINDIISTAFQDGSDDEILTCAQLCSSFKKKNSAYFEKASDAMNSMAGRDYYYGITAYTNGENLIDYAEMFFGETAESDVKLHFAVKNYDDREYSREGNTAVFEGTKDDVKYKYSVSYDLESQSFSVSVYKDSELTEKLECDIESDGVLKKYYNKRIGRTYFSSAKSDNSVSVRWYDAEYDINTEPDKSAGYIDFDGVKLSGEVK